MVDIHVHILPGLDDGVADLEAALALAREASAAGVGTVAATPHVRDDFPTTVEEMRSGVVALSAALAHEGIPLEVRDGAEVALDWIPRLDPDALLAFCLGGTRRYLLVEFPYEGWPRAVDLVLGRLAELGITAVLAHPERNGSVQEDPSRLRGLLDTTGALVQVTVASLAGEFGAPTQKAGRRLLEAGLAHVVASDVHGPGRTRSVWALPGDVPLRLAEWLTVTVPSAILSGNDVPPRPAVAGRIRVLRRLLDRWASGSTQPRNQENR